MNTNNQVYIKMECVQIDLNNVCRTCKNESAEMKSLCYRDSESVKESPRLDEMLMACTSVQVNNEDDLPKSICRSCFVQLINAYSFKEQCEKTDSFLRDYLKSLKKESIKEEIITDLEFTSNFIGEISSTLNDTGQINDDESIENVKDDPEHHSGESREKDVDYVQVVGSNLAIYECRTCSKVCYMLEDLRCHEQTHVDNVVDHVKMEFEDNTITFSKMEVKEEETEGKEEEAEVDNGDECESDTSTNSEYLPTNQTPTKINRDRGRPRKHSVSFKPIGKCGEHHPLQKPKTESSKNEIGNFPYPQCKEIFTKISLLEKYAERHDDLRIHECDLCDKKFSRWSTLKRHKLSHGKVKPFECVTCGKRFARRDHLQKHMKLHLSMGVHSCDLCLAVFCGAKNLAKHKASKHNIVEKVVREKRYECQNCQKGFTTEKYRDSHMKSHFGDGKFQCKTCEKTFASKTYLTKHMKFHDDSSKKFLCSECGKRFNRSDSLAIHMRTHTGEKPFKCKFCGKGFPRMTDLTVHERHHTGEKRHVCGICGRRFGSAYILTVHMRTHTGEKPYRCTYCDDVFRYGSDLKTHVRKHTGERFQCELCPKAYIMRYLLTQHKRVVHGLDIVRNKSRPQDDSPPVVDSVPLELQQSEVS